MRSPTGDGPDSVVPSAPKGIAGASHGDRPRFVPRIVAHRGSPDPGAGIVENTLAAFGRARRLGADGFELDVRRTADGMLVVHHDPSILELGLVARLPAREIPPHVPPLAAVLEVPGDAAVTIEIKNAPTEPEHDPEELTARGVAAMVTDMGLVDRVVVSSFWPRSLDAVRDATPEIARGLLLASWFDPFEGLALARAHGCSAVHPHADLVTAELVSAAHGAGLSVTAWVVSDRLSLEAIARCGVDAVITDDVTAAVTAYGKGL